MGIILNLTGIQFERLTVISKSHNKAKDTKPLWLCLCKCGNITEAKTIDLRSGKKKSCGCLRFDCITNLKHGQGGHRNKSREYRIWQGMIQRVRNPKSPAYKNYGGKGIKYCDRWALFENFFSDMGKCPSNLYSLDRKESNGDYTKDNCRWATQYIQQRNRSNNHWIEFDGKKLVLQDWSKILKTTPTNILNQLKRKEFPDVYKFYMNKINV